MAFSHKEEHVDEGMLLLQANIDDMNPEWTSAVMDRLFALGANDVYWVPIVMKKGRPGIMLNVLCADSLAEEAKSLIFRETTTLGLRIIPLSVHRLSRAFLEVETPWGSVPVKIGSHNGQVVQYAPEFDVCDRIAREQKIPLKEVYDAVRYAYKARTQSELSD
ncbi:DUF111 family protein [Xylanibacillus composti]|uniref:DUF111 family protein n=1 Tax=Xylanibacillus composti TaxID=1572762 RepID=A0A8J4H2T8_9BACL|nr:nickel insertion protein [Xylanibacillus composti]MDT9723550.1 DUF111 family protein [Xylanibacillus composti]GIQ68412.1 hypothetical protein XYCOK13_12360 [Xylanibacillus composti]